MEALMDLLEDIRIIEAAPLTWLLDTLIGYTQKGKLAAAKLAFWVLCFAILMGSISGDGRLMVSLLVPVFTWKDFSLNWLQIIVWSSFRVTCIYLGENWMMQKHWRIWLSIQDDHNWKVLGDLDDLLTLPSITSCAACLLDT